MSYYIRNSFAEIHFHNEELIVMGGKYNKKIKANELVCEILKSTSRPIKEEKLIAHICQKLNIGIDACKSSISKLLSLGYIEANEVCKIFQMETITKTNNNIESLCIPTYCRPTELESCLESYVINYQKYSHDIKYYVFDDTPVDRSNSNRQILEKLSKKLSIEIFYIGIEEKNELIGTLVRECNIDKKLLEFAFMPKNIFKDEKLFASGANRNCILAYTMGEYFFMADDDSCCLMLENCDNLNIYFSKGRGNINKQYIKNEDLKSIQYRNNIDILGMHEKYLGKVLKEILYENEIYDITVDMISTDNNIFPNNKCLYESSKINFTFNTTIGWPDQTADEVLYDYLNNEDINYLLGVSNKFIVETAPGNIIYSKPFLLTTTLTGIDNTKCLCPFIPVYRNEDIHYSYLLNYLNPYSLSGCINVGLLHNKKKTINQLDAFKRNFYSDTVLSYILYTLLDKLKIEIPQEYLDLNIRKVILSNTIKKICGNSKFDLTNNLMSLNINLNKVWKEKSKLLYKVYTSSKMRMEAYDIDEHFENYNAFICNEEWELIRRVLLLYCDLLIEWDNIMSVCYKLKLEQRLPCRKI